MDNLIVGASASNRAIFTFEGKNALSENSPSEFTIPAGELTLAKPSAKRDAACWPVRGDLAHIRLAGICFVPHYAVPMPHGVICDGNILSAPRDDADSLGTTQAGERFNVLDIAGDWAWGQIGEDGLVGYLPLTALNAA